MPDDEIVLEVEGVETTVVEEERPEPSSPFALIGAGTIGDPGSAAGAGGHPDFGAGAGTSGIVIDGATGEVVGTATVNPDTGVAEIPGVEVTVVEENSSSTEGPAAPTLQPASVEPTPAETATPPVDDAQPDMGFGPHGVIPPGAFGFRPRGPNRQATDCVPIIFTAQTPIGRVSITVGVVVEAPLRLRDGTPVTVRKAQLDSASAATAVAENMVDLMNLGAINATEVRATFSERMDEIMRTHGIGYRVQRCTPP
jgi:hypothetical protein